MADLVRYDVADGAARVTLDSPTNRNALSVRLTDELLAALLRAQADPEVRVVVLASTGPVFCSGLDLTEQRARAAAGPEDPTLSEAALPEVLSALWSSSTPVVCRVQGPARAGGLGLIAASDIVVAHPSATFAFSEVRLGVVPAIISGPCLARMTPRAGLELLLTGEVFDAVRAVTVGLVNTVSPSDGLDATVDRYVGLLRSGGPESLRITKELVQRRSPDIAAALTVDAALSRERFLSDEAREGMAAFAAKRRPAWDRWG